MWRIAPKDNTGAIAVAEPKHRTVAVGISSGVSLRTFPKSTVQKVRLSVHFSRCITLINDIDFFFLIQVREICVHYVEKCSGKYENNKTAARYVYQMADEVINQLAGVAAQIRSAQRNEPDNMQELLDEWSIHFPPSLHSIGSPKAVALKLQRQTEELKEVRDELANEKSNHAREISEIMKSLDIQLHASCEGVMSERRQQLLTYEQQNADFEHQIRNAKVENDSIIGRLKMEYDATLNRVQDDFNNRLLEKSNLVAQVKRELKETKESNILEKSEADRIRRSENEDYSNQMIKLKSQLMAIQGVLPNSDSKDSFGLDSLQCDVESIVSLPCEEEKLQKKKQSMKFTGKVAKAVKQLKEVRQPVDIVDNLYVPSCSRQNLIINLFIIIACLETFGFFT